MGDLSYILTGYETLPYKIFINENLKNDKVDITPNIVYIPTEFFIEWIYV